MGVAKPEPITLKPEEQLLLHKINFDQVDDPDVLRPSCTAAAALACSLLRRRAIWDVRLRYFTDPQLNIGGRGKSHKQVFEANGTRGDAILKHPHFLKYLKYFILGPYLPKRTIAQFRRIVVDDLGTSGTVRDQLRSFVRAETRRLSSGPRKDLAEEFFKLALECGLDVWLAGSIRDAVRTTK